MNLEKCQTKIQTLESQIETYQQQEFDYNGKLSLFERTELRNDQNQRFRTIVDALKREIHSKYTAKMLQVKASLQQTKIKFDKSLINQQKEVKKLQMQHQVEKATIQEQFDFIYKKYKEKKDELKKLSDQKKALEKAVDWEKKSKDNQRKIYEKMFTEGMSIEDVHKVLDRYAQKVEERRLGRTKPKEAKENKHLDGALQPDLRATNFDHIYGNLEPDVSRAGLLTQK